MNQSAGDEERIFPKSRIGGKTWHVFCDYCGALLTSHRGRETCSNCRAEWLEGVNVNEGDGARLRLLMESDEMWG